MSEKSEKVAVLWDKANKDYLTSKALIETGDLDCFSGSICFHCQQCAEKCLKAFLMHNEIDFPKTHDLLLLLRLCSEINSGFNEFDLSEFSSFGVEIRYDDALPTIDETKKAFEAARAVMDYVKGEIL